MRPNSVQYRRKCLWTHEHFDPAAPSAKIAAQVTLVGYLDIYFFESGHKSIIPCKQTVDCQLTIKPIPLILLGPAETGSRSQPLR